MLPTGCGSPNGRLSSTAAVPLAGTTTPIAAGTAPSPDELGSTAISGGSGDTRAVTFDELPRVDLKGLAGSWRFNDVSLTSDGTKQLCFGDSTGNSCTEQDTSFTQIQQISSTEMNGERSPGYRYIGLVASIFVRLVIISGDTVVCDERPAPGATFPSSSFFECSIPADVDLPSLAYRFTDRAGDLWAVEGNSPKAP